MKNFEPHINEPSGAALFHCQAPAG